MKKQVKVWVDFADRDLLTVSEIIKNPELTNIAAFHCQQAIEKYFKAFLIEYEKPFHRIHNLLTLYGTIKEITDLRLDEDLLATINNVYSESRYPSEIGLFPDGSIPTIDTANRFYTFTKEVVAIIREKLNNL
jgi:HEPN domain-containing protein